MSNNDRPNIWYKPVPQSAYNQIKQMGGVSITLRLLPSIAENGMVSEALLSKDVSRSKFPNVPKWLVSVLVINDPLNPANNGFVGIMEITGTLRKCIQNKNTPQNYFDLNQGYDFNLNCTIEPRDFSAQRDESDMREIPIYYASKFADQPSQTHIQHIENKWQTTKTKNFAEFVNMLNNPKPRNNNQGGTQQYSNNQGGNFNTMNAGGNMNESNFNNAPAQNNNFNNAPANNNFNNFNNAPANNDAFGNAPQEPFQNNQGMNQNQNVAQNQNNFNNAPQQSVDTGNQVPTNSGGDSFDDLFGSNDGGGVPF